MAPNKRLVAVGLAKQTAKGSPAANPTFWLPVTGGKPGNWNNTEAPIEVASDKPLWSEVDRTSVIPGAEYESLAYAKAMGLQLLAALGSITTTGSGVPYQHVIVPAFDVPYTTLFGKLFGGDYLKIADCKIDEMEITGDNAGSLRIKQTFMGVTLAWDVTPYTPGTDLTVGGFPLFRSAGGTFKFSASDGTPVVSPVSKWSFKIARGVSAVPQAASVQPRDVSIGVADITASFTIVPDDMLDMRKALTGSASGTTISNVPVYGSFDFLLSIDANTDLRFVSSRCRTAIPVPDADPKGGPVELAVEGSVLQPQSGDGFVCTLHNDVSSY